MKDGMTPLWMASQKGHEPVVVLLLSHNADPNIACNDGLTPLHVALLQDHESVFQLLQKEYQKELQPMAEDQVRR